MQTNFIAIKEFMLTHFQHYNAKIVVDASISLVNQLKKNNKIIITLAGAMSTGELGISLAEMIRKNKVHAICCTAANLEEDVFNLIAHNSYYNIPNWRSLTDKEEQTFAKIGLNRVTDTCIPEKKAMKKIENYIFEFWKNAEIKKPAYFPHEFLYQLLLSNKLKKYYEINPNNSWILAAAKKNLPIFTPGWEDSSLANAFVALYLKGKIKKLSIIKNGLQTMEQLIYWYKKITKNHEVGFFQIGGGIAGDFPICVVPLIAQDLKEKTKLWSYFCQISDSTTSYGSYSGAIPNEKITWGKLGTTCPKFIIESDATIVAPLIFAFILAS